MENRFLAANERFKRKGFERIKRSKLEGYCETNPDEDPQRSPALDTPTAPNLALTRKLKYGAWPN